MKQQHVTLSVADGTSMQAYTVIPSDAGSGPFPALILLQEAFGVNGHIRNVAGRLAEQGFAVIAPEIFHRTAAPGLEIPYGDFSLVMPHYQAINLQHLEDDLKASYQWLQEQPDIAPDKIGSIGFCLGGRVSFVANATLPLKAAVSYYGGSLDQVAHLAPQLSGAHLFVWGGMDKHIPQEVRDKVVGAVEEAGKPYANVVFSYADHAFNSDERPAYQPEAAREAWALAMAFLKNKMG